MALTPIPLTADGTGPKGAVPVSIAGGGGGEPVEVRWEDISNQPAVIAAGATQAAARTAIGAGTSNVAVATTAPVALAATAAVGTGTSAARADHVHPLPTAAQVGAAAATHNQAATTVTVAAIPGLTGANAQLALADLQSQLTAAVARIAALETP